MRAGSRRRHARTSSASTSCARSWPRRAFGGCRPWPAQPVGPGRTWRLWSSGSAGSGACDRMTRTDELTVLLDVPARHAGQNPYISLLAESLRARGARVQFFTWRRALLGRYSVLHAHWPEYLVWHRRFLVRTAYQMGAAVLALRLRLQQRPVVRTVHNRTPHDALPGRLRT